MVADIEKELGVIGILVNHEGIILLLNTASTTSCATALDQDTSLHLRQSLSGRLSRTAPDIFLISSSSAARWGDPEDMMGPSRTWSLKVLKEIRNKAKCRKVLRL